MASSRRTRSQLALPDIDINQLARSPLKDARQAFRNNQSLQTTSESETFLLSPVSQTASEPLFSPTHRHSKRPSSPWKEERDFKRPRHDDSREENRSPLLGPSRPPSASSIREPSLNTTTKFRRAQSVPIWPSAPVIDFNRIPRSPSKPSSMLRIAVIPTQYLPAVRHELSAEPIADSVGPHASERATSPPAFQAPPVVDDIHPLHPVPPRTRTPEQTTPLADIMIDDIPVAPPEWIASPVALDVAPRTPERTSPPPTSPLSPLTPLSEASKLPSGSSHASSDNEPDTTVTDAAPSMYALATTPKRTLNIAPVTPSTSRLPRPSFRPASKVPLPKALKAPSKRQEKGRLPRLGPIPLGGRMTRSASLRQKKDSAKKEGTAEASTPRPDVLLQTTLAARFTPAKPTANVASTSNTSPSKPTPLHHRRSFSFSFAQPTASSVAKVGPGSPEKDKRRSVLPAPSGSSMKPASAAASTSTALNSSLSSLSLALQKLSMPAPSRPVTSMGFHSEEKQPSTVAPPSSRPRPASVAAAGPMHRSATVDDLLFKTPAPPPPETKKRISVHSGIIAGTPRGKISFGRSTPVAGPAGPSTIAAPRSALRVGMFGGTRAFPRASKKSSLPVVEGSPVKHGGAESTAEAVNEEGALLIEQAVERQQSETVAGPSSEGTAVGAAVPSPSAVPLKRDNSRRASLALQLVRDQIAQPPQTPVASADTQEGSSTKPEETFRRAPSAYRFNLRDRPEPKSAPAALKRSASGSHVAGKGKGKRVSGEGDEAGEGTPERMRGVLRECTVFVDVRTDDGDDAGGLFVDMLTDMGAKVLTRVGQTCTHVVFKNGLMSTLTRYRLLKEPRPIVVGIAWIVECAEQCKRVDEERFLISLDGVNVAGTQKRRRSMLPRRFHTLQGTGADMHTASPHIPTPKSVPRMSSPTQAEVQRSSSPSLADTDEANRSGSSQTLHPLEMARKRRNGLQGT